MPRAFNGSASITTSIGALTAFNFGMMIALARRADEANWHGIMGDAQSGVPEAYLDIAPSSHATASAIWTSWNGTDHANTLKMTQADGWCIVAATKATGTTTPRYHKYVFSTQTWTHDNGVGSVPNATSTPTGTVTFGTAGGDALTGDIAAAAFYGRTFTDQEIENFAASWEVWLSYGPVAAWLFDQDSTGQNLLDWTGGGANQSSITGTTVQTASLPGWNVSDGGVWAAEIIAGTTSWSADAVLTATATLTVGATLAATSAAALTGTATLTAAGTRTAVSGAGLTGTATLTAGASASLTSSAALTATATLTAAADISGAAATLTAAATLAAGALLAATAGTTLVGTATLTAAATLASASATLTATAALTAAATRTAVSAAALTATAALTAVPMLATVAAATLPVTATLTAGAVVGSVAFLTATATLTAADIRTAVAGAAFTGTATLTAGALATFAAAAALTGTATLAAAGQIAGVPGAALAILAVFAATGDLTLAFTVGALTAGSTATSSLTTTISRGGPT